MRLQQYIGYIVVILAVLFFAISVYGPWSVYTSGSPTAESLYVTCVILTVIVGVITYIIFRQEYSQEGVTKTGKKLYTGTRISTILLLVILLIVLTTLAGTYAALAKIMSVA